MVLISHDLAGQVSSLKRGRIFFFSSRLASCRGLSRKGSTAKTQNWWFPSDVLLIKVLRNRSTFTSPFDSTEISFPLETQLLRGTFFVAKHRASLRRLIRPLVICCFVLVKPIQHSKITYFTFCWPCIMSWSLVNDQRDAQFFSMYLFIFLTLYMFWAHRAHHQERQIVSMQHLVAVTLCRWLCRVQVANEHSHRHRVTATRGCIDTICLSWWARCAGNM